MGKLVKYVLLPLLLLCLLGGGIVFTVIDQSKDTGKGDITVREDGESIVTVEKTETVIEVSCLDFYPGKRVEYDIHLVGKGGGRLTEALTLRFASEEECTLGDYLLLTVKTDSLTEEKTLSAWLGESEPLSLAENTSTLTLIYHMPESVGNEAQGTKADFRLLLHAEGRKEETP